ncbi:outer membrane protein assembly factor BamD [Candidatus Magnetominusculus dajiuhuensis]|uniref:outer membrane protein assembly factor BamD n=1 Tax=Candidatus Magnetominusculus dajiuhuensis TaxID=3137712 RepID=UPI003B42D78A
MNKKILTYVCHKIFNIRVMSKTTRLLIIAALTLAFCVACAKEVVKPAYENPKDSYAKAIQLIEDKEYDAGRGLLVEITNRDTVTEYAPLAQLKIAESYMKTDEPEVALEEYRKFLKNYPDNKYSSYAKYQVATLTFNTIEGPDRGYKAAYTAIKEFQGLNEQYPRNPYKEIVPLRIEKSRNVLAEHEFYVGEFYLKKDAFSAALRRFNVIISKYPEYPDMGKLYYHMGLAYKGMGDSAKAREYIEKAKGSTNDTVLLKKIDKELSKLKS